LRSARTSSDPIHPSPPSTSSLILATIPCLRSFSLHEWPVPSSHRFHRAHLPACPFAMMFLYSLCTRGRVREMKPIPARSIWLQAQPSAQCRACQLLSGDAQVTRHSRGALSHIRCSQTQTRRCPSHDKESCGDSGDNPAGSAESRALAPVNVNAFR